MQHSSVVQVCQPLCNIQSHPAAPASRQLMRSLLLRVCSSRQDSKLSQEDEMVKGLTVCATEASLHAQGC